MADAPGADFFSPITMKEYETAHAATRAHARRVLKRRAREVLPSASVDELIEHLLAAGVYLTKQTAADLIDEIENEDDWEREERERIARKKARVSG